VLKFVNYALVLVVDCNVLPIDDVYQYRNTDLASELPLGQGIESPARSRRSTIESFLMVLCSCQFGLNVEDFLIRKGS